MNWIRLLQVQETEYTFLIQTIFTYPFYLDELLNLHRGQGLDLVWRDSLQCPTENEYISMVKDSTFENE